MAKFGVIICNIGTPKSTRTWDVASYLREFLMDKFVIDKPWLFRFLLVNGIIAPFRAPKSAALYKKVWSSERGSPLMYLTRDFGRQVEAVLGDDFKVVVGMRYGQPSLSQAIDAVSDCDEIILFPQYPQYAESSTRTCMEKFDELIHQKGIKKPLHRIGPFFRDISFIDSLAQRMQEDLAGREIDHLLFSFHSLPARHVMKIDPTGNTCGNWESCCDNSQRVLATCYRAQCFATARAVATKLQKAQNSFTVSFQSRLGREQWLPPYTDHVLAELPRRGYKRLAVVTPSFVTDCLETLEEIAGEGRNIFMAAGGEEFIYLNCLNDHPKWVQCAANLVREQTQHSVSSAPIIPLKSRPEGKLS